MELETQATGPSSRRSAPPRVELPPAADGQLDQGEPWCWVNVGGIRRRLGLRDRGAIFEVPGLYEELAVQRLRWRLPKYVVRQLSDAMALAGEEPKDHRAIDIRAGNGMVGEALRRAGVGHVVGVDFLPEARAAALRDRPGAYDDYLVADLTALDGRSRQRMDDVHASVLTMIAPLGIDEMPVRAFAAAWNAAERRAWIALNLRDSARRIDDRSGFSALLRRMQEGGLLETHSVMRYPHRLSTRSATVSCYALVGRKDGDLPERWLTSMIAR